jgi:uncharacterized protein
LKQNTKIINHSKASRYLGSTSFVFKVKVMQKIKIGITLIGISVLVWQCKPKPSPQEEVFDKGTLLTNVGTNFILPNYIELKNDLILLESAYTTFVNDQTQNNLDLVVDAWKSASLKWNLVSTFEFGPAMNLGLRSALGTFPVDTTKVINNITNGGYVLGGSTNIDAIGFSALDFLLGRVNALSYFSGNTAYSTYGLEVIQKMKGEVESVVSSWNSSYLTTFKNSTGTESTSGFSLLVNEFCKNYELSKNAKLGIPIGKQSLGIARPEYLEARFNAFSLEVLKRNVEGLQILFNGNTVSNNTPGVGFDDYLVDLNKSNLSASINTQFSDILTHINTINNSMEEELIQNPQSLDVLYTKMQNLVVSLKTDMASAFGVLITYQDNDGD